MKKQLALALTAALLAFPVTPSLVMAATTATGTTTTSTTTQPVDTSITTTPTPNTTLSTSVPTDSTTTTSSAITITDKNGNIVDPGILPGSPWYWFQTLIEKVQVALTFDPVKKADLTESQALENLAEAQALINKGDTTAAEKSLAEYSNKIEQAQTFLDQLKDPNSETAQKVQAALTKVNTNNMVVLGGLLEKLPPQAAQKLALNIVRSVEKAVVKADKMDNKAAKETSSAATTTGLTAATTDTASTTGTTNAASTTGTTDQEQLKEQAKQALKQFQTDLGLKKAEDKEDQNKEDQNKEDSAQTEQKTEQQQYQTHQPQVSQPANITSEKHNDQERNQSNKNGEKEKRNRD
ncbi:DUF5667 domain-containing protein [Desulfitobacterium sp.]|uniref:DUF5667 domain-containing protein n=1 Tax=Desulfitobacterium sp. TaxID=49981 RepID=UPI002CF0464A|nr:DUF5667 domain-containing protein [Desulfitobacterium sp.]HVJ50768.1 DUF5667 domain-containing protein [Desulfitobacterium sp.]